MQHVYLLITTKPEDSVSFILVTEQPPFPVSQQYTDHILVEVEGEQDILSSLTFLVNGEIELERRFE
jgi:hypothetical protein